MRPIFALILLLAALSLPATAAPGAAKPAARMPGCATCYGGHDCRACHTCEYCAHCNSGAKDKCDVFYIAQGQKPPWEKKAKPAAKAKTGRHRHRHAKG